MLEGHVPHKIYILWELYKVENEHSGPSYRDPKFIYVDIHHFMFDILLIIIQVW